MNTQERVMLIECLARTLSTLRSMPDISKQDEETIQEASFKLFDLIAGS